MMAVQLTVLCDESEQVARVMESLGRVGAGIALDGHTVTASIVTVEEDE